MRSFMWTMSQYQQFLKSLSKALAAGMAWSQKNTSQVGQLIISGLNQVNKTALPRKLTLWCFQFGLLPCLMWPISIFKVTLTHAMWLERLVNAQIWKWLGLPRCLARIDLHSNGVFSLLISSLVKEYKQGSRCQPFLGTDCRLLVLHQCRRHMPWFILFVVCCWFLFLLNVLMVLFIGLYIWLQ